MKASTVNLKPFTIRLPEELVWSARVVAANQRRRLNEVIKDLLIQYTKEYYTKEVKQK